jgi:hypothetical protein
MTMKNMTTKIILSAAMATLAIAPIAATAKTRAGDSQAIYTTSSGPGLGRAAKGQKLAGEDVAIGILIAGVLIGGIVLLDDENVSPGT